MPEGYKPVRTQSEIFGDSASVQQTPDGYQIPDGTSRPYDPQAIPGGDSESLPFIKPEDVSYFSALLNEVDEEGLSAEDLRERRIMMLLLKVKNGTPPMRKTALNTDGESQRIWCWAALQPDPAASDESNSRRPRKTSACQGYR